MNYNTVYVGMDVHKESFSLCAYTIEAEKASHYQRTEADYKKVLNYLEFLRTIYGDDANFICGYEAGCFGYTLNHQLTANNVKCIILAPTTMLEQRSKKRIKTDRRDAEIIAVRAYSFIRFRWLDNEKPREYFELKMTNNELTNDFVLEITDFTNADEANDLRELWESQVDTLRRTCGF